MRLKELREARGLSQSELAKLADVNIRTIQSYEQGLRDINKAEVLLVYRIAKALRCKIEDIIEITA